MPHSTTPSARVHGLTNARRIRPRTVKVWKCDGCGTVYDNEPRDQISGCGKCPRCNTGQFLKETRVKD